MNKIQFKDKLVSINRITKVVKGGRRFTFSALVVVGDYAGSVGVGYAKAKQVPDAIKKATQSAKNNLIKINGTDKELVGNVAAEIRMLKPAEPYKGKGIKERGQYILRKEGKKK